MYAFKNGTWKYTQKMIPSFEAGDDVGTSVAVAGNFVVLGAPLNDRFAKNSGSVYIFQREEGGDTFSQSAALYQPMPEVSALFGWSVAVNKDGVIAVGARAARVARGSVYVYKNTGAAQWTLAGILEPQVTQDPMNGGNFGWDVAINDENTLVVGAPHEGEGNGKVGALFLYKEVSTNNWDLFDKVTPEDGKAGDLYGFSVDIDDSTVVVGAKNATFAGIQGAGRAFIHKVPSGNTGNITYHQRLQAGTPIESAFYGQSVAIADGRLCKLTAQTKI